MSTHIDGERVKRKYRWNALVYDALVHRPTPRLRALAVEQLALHRGETALDFWLWNWVELRLAGTSGR
jgi:hypothetical protein